MTALIAFLFFSCFVYFVVLTFVGVFNGNIGEPTEDEKVAAAVITAVIMVATGIVAIVKNS